MNRSRAFWVVGAVLMFSGLTVTSSGSTAYTSTNGNRTITVNVAEDSSAYLTVLGTNAGTTPNFGSSLNTDMTVTLDSAGTGAEFDVDDNGNFQSPPVSFSLTSGQDRDVDITANENDITVDVSASLASGGSIEFSRVFEIPQSEQIVLTPNVLPSRSSGKYSFEIKNNGSVNVTLDGIRINTSSNENVVNIGGNGGDILTTTTTDVPVTTNVIPIDNSNSGSATIVDFDQALVPINIGETVEFSLDRSKTEAKVKEAHK